MSNLYELIYKKAPFGCAVYKVNIDDNKEVTSYELKMMNPKFNPTVFEDVSSEILYALKKVALNDDNYSYRWFDAKEERWYQVYAYSPDYLYFALKVIDISGEVHTIQDQRSEIERQKHDEARNASLLKLMKTKYDSIEILLEDTLDEIINLTESEIGYIYYYDEVKQEFILNNWSKNVMDVCKVMDPQTTYNLCATGIWGEAVRQRKPIILNDYNAPNEFKKGLPKGHAPLSSFLTVPVFDVDEIIAVVGVANKKTPYDQNDVYQLTLLMSNVWAFAKNIKANQRMKYLSYHDQLTGIYNRFYFEEEINRLDTVRQLPLSIIIGDVNGLKLTNDVFGHLEGDKILKYTADMLKKTCRQEDIIARWGGDEFIILLPQTSSDVAMQICQRIESSMTDTDTLAITPSISLGFATKVGEEQAIAEIIKDAENLMYKQKLTESKSQRSKIIDSMRQTLYEKSHETEEHAERLKRYSLALGRLLGMNKESLYDLELFAVLHDIGKIGIPEDILNKPDPLTDEEWVEMRKHPEIGYRIAQSSPDLAQIAEYILTHHERCDATGYPRGLKKDEIPLASRIVSIVDAYDAMTSDRPYRKAMSKEAAIWELKRCSGKQFDPDILELFISLLTMNEIAKR